MTRSAFDNFLYAPIGEDKNGMLLSVLSALARQGIDPWQEAARLAVLPGKTAAHRLASMIAALPEGPSTHLDPGPIAARLISLLPRTAGANIQLRKPFLGKGIASNSRGIIYAVFIALLFGALCVAASRRPPGRLDDAHAPISRTVAPQIPPLSSGQLSSGQ
jgi:hypothetical protein